MFIQQKNKNHHQNFLHIYKILPTVTSLHKFQPFPYKLCLFVCQQNSSQTSKAGLWALEVARPRGKDNSKEAPAWRTKALHGTQKEPKRRFQFKGSWLIEIKLHFWLMMIYYDGDCDDGNDVGVGRGLGTC